MNEVIKYRIESIQDLNFKLCLYRQNLEIISEKQSHSKSFTSGVLFSGTSANLLIFASLCNFNRKIVKIMSVGLQSLNLRVQN